jgi:hypothetical protein
MSDGRMRWKVEVTRCWKAMGHPREWSPSISMVTNLHVVQRLLNSTCAGSAPITWNYIESTGGSLGGGGGGGGGEPVESGGVPSLRGR